ncbi:hypothetical protein R3P38DRAFT_3180556 [Favolaschia claudopus]|uniref:F-box domain-containing protein n=1 Tax=Favolaschia claudopus TaxID=2862362 RepID=A0AAW0CN86_9AGAR
MQDDHVLALLRESASRSMDDALLRFMDSILNRVLAVCGTSVSTSPILQCPTEVFSLLFRWVLFGLEPVSTEFRVQRAKLSLVCRMWWKVVIGDAGLWQDVFVTPASECDVISRIMHFTRSHPLSVYLVDDTPCHRYGSSERQSYLLSHFNSILPTSARWVRLELVSSSAYTHKAMLDHINDHNSPELRCLTLRSPSRAAVMTPTPLAATIYCSHLRRLVLHRCTFPEAFPELLPNLVVLSLCDVPTLHSPTQSQLFRLLRIAPHLDRLEMVRVGIRISTDDPVPVVDEVHIPSVTTLVLAFNVTLHPARAFFNILEHIKAPNLAHLHLGLPTDADVKRYLAAHPGLKAPSVSLAGRFTNSEAVQLLFASFYRVTHLDLVEADRPAVLRHLGSLRGSLTPLVLPLLTCLRVRPLHWAALTDGLMARLRADSARVQLILVPHEGASRSIPSEYLSAYQTLLQSVDSVAWGEYIHRETHNVLRYPYLQ